MRYEDRISIATPEGVTLELILAGLGSRFVAALLDGLIQGSLLVALAVVTWLAPGSGALAAMTVVGAFLVFFGYDIAFETFASGRTPGKRWTGLRVVREGGAPIGFLTSTVRNLLRLVDMLPAVYLVGMATILASRRNQRVGDLVAGTLVVRERTAALSPAWQPPVEATDAVSSWDVSAVTAEEVATVRRFIARRATLLPEARDRLARELAVRLRPKVIGPSDSLVEGQPERFLEDLLGAKAARE